MSKIHWPGETNQDPASSFHGMTLERHFTQECGFCTAEFKGQVWKDESGNEHREERECPRCWREYH